MTRDEKEQRIAKPDGKIFEIKNVQIEQTYLNPNYACLHTSATVMTPTGHLKIFELAPKSKGMTSFAARWDEKEDALDIDIQEVSSVDEFWFIHEKHGYVGHHSTRALNNTASIYTYNVLIRTPQERIFEAIVSFTAVRRVGISGTARIITASREEKIFDQEILGQYPPWAFGEKQAFCAACQTVTMQTFAVDRNNEIVVTCRCSRFLKFPLTETQEQLDALLEAHQKANQGQVRA